MTEEVFLCLSSLNVLHPASRSQCNSVAHKGSLAKNSNEKK